MNELEIIRDYVGYDSYNKGTIYPKRYIELLENNEKTNNMYYHFRVESETTYRFYNVKIIMNNGRIFSTYCSCPQYKNVGKCKHIAACLINYRKEFFKQSKEERKYYISNKILSNFHFEKTQPKLKRQLSLEVELIVDEPYNSYYRNEPLIELKVKIGIDKLYNLNNRMRNFISCYKNGDGTLTFGKNFTYDPNIHIFNEEDEKIIIELINLCSKNQYYTSNSLYFDLGELKKMLTLLKNKDIFILGEGTFHGIKEENPIKMDLIKKDKDYILKIEKNKKLVKLTDNYELIIYENNLYHLSGDYLKLLSMMNDEEIEELTFTENNIDQFKNNLLPIIKKNIQISNELKEEIIIGVEPVPKLYIDYNNDMITIDYKLNYDGNEISFFDNSDKIIRDRELEYKVVDDLIKFNFTELNNQYVLTELEDIVNFINNDLEELGKKYDTFTTNKLRETKVFNKTSISSNFSIGKDNILKYSFDLGEINKSEIADVLDSLRNKKRYFKLKDGNIIKLDDNENLEEFDKLIDSIDLNDKEIKNGEGTIPKYRAIFIDSLKTNNNKSLINCDNKFKELINKFKKNKNSDIELSDKDKKVLRDYQEVGIKWLYNIYKCGFGGILADEMGLGKSIQLIYLIRQIIKEKNDAKILIVSPTALVYNWENEFDKFGSELKYKVFSENRTSRKQQLKELNDTNILITSYGLIREDYEEYSNMYFELIAIDEAQTIKNYTSRMTKDIKSLNANTKLALTGTPVENNVLELWSIFDFIMPGYLTNIKKFSSKYNIKEVDEDNLKRLDLLTKQINPFILRRKKKDVIKELPPKIENNIYISLYPEQKKVYVAELEKTKKDIEYVIETEGFTKASFKILQLLTKLRQICIDPRIVYENYDGGSAKIDNLIKVVKEVVANNHKILIFTNYLTALNIVNKELMANGISTYIIDGSVKSRKRIELVDKFNADDTNVFLITLKSGGTGLNLTSADVVIHLDLWWNPQVENQATDRAHRIGQVNTVEVIKLITEGTIEERILELQNKKKILSSSLIDGNDIDKNLISKLTEKDIKHLLSIDNNE